MCSIRRTTMAGRGSFGASETTASYSTYSSGGSSNEFNRLYQTVSNNVQKITQNATQMKRLAAQIGTPQDSPDLRDRLHQVQHYTNQLAKDTNKMMKDLSAVSMPSNQSEQRQRKIQKERLMNDFTSALKNFQSEQRLASEKEKASLQRAKEHSTHSSDPFRSSEPTFQDDPFAPQQSSPQQVIQMEEDVDVNLLREREQALRQLESDIMDVNQIFADLGTMVHEQGEIVDSIETHVEETYSHVESGTEQLSKAREYQSKARMKKCILIIILVVVLAVIGLIIGLSVKNS